jgi:c-di-GMP-binding flagellar brake protein YcgR
MSVLPNQKITLYVETAHGSSIHITKIEDVQDDVVLVAAPIERRTLVPIGIGSRVQLEYKDTSLTGQGRYIAKGIVIRRMRGQVPMLEVRLFEPWQKIQERMFVRVDVLLETTYAPVLDGQIQAVSQCSILNLSGGGLWMLAQEALAAGDIIWLCLPLEQGSIQAYGEIVRVEDGEEGFGYGVSFVNLPERDRKAIIQYVYQRQLELRRKGLIQPHAGGS